MCNIVCSSTAQQNLNCKKKTISERGCDASVHKKVDFVSGKTSSDENVKYLKIRISLDFGKFPFCKRMLDSCWMSGWFQSEITGVNIANKCAIGFCARKCFVVQLIFYQNINDLLQVIASFLNNIRPTFSPLRHASKAAFRGFKCKF